MGNFTASSPYCDQGLEMMKDDPENDSLHELLQTYNFPTCSPYLSPMNDLKEIVKSESTRFLDDLPAGSMQKIFWQQQVEAASLKNARNMRWYPLFFIIFFLCIKARQT